MISSMSKNLTDIGFVVFITQSVQRHIELYQIIAYYDEIYLNNKLMLLVNPNSLMKKTPSRWMALAHV